MKQFFTITKKMLKVAGTACMVMSSWVANAQILHINQNFNGTSGTTPPTGWSQNKIAGAANSDNWNFSNPGGRTIAAPMSSPAAIFDSDNMATFVNENVALESPAVNTTGFTTVKLKWDQFFAGIYNTNFDGIFVEVFDGTTWQSAYSNTTLAYPGAAASLDLDVSTHAANRTGVRVRFRFVGNYSWWWIVDNVQLYTPVVDVRATSVAFLSNGSCGTANDQVVVRIQNLGPAALTNIPVVLNISGAVTANLNATYTRSLASNASDTIIFSNTYNTLNGGNYILRAYTNLGADLVRSNDTVNNSVAMIGTPTAPSVTNGSRCGAGSVALSAVGASSQDSLFWFNSPSSLNQIGQGSNFNTPVLSSTSIFYVEPRRGGIADSVQTPTPTGNNQSGAMFDLLSTKQLRLDSFKFYSVNTGTFNVSIYYRVGSYVGNETNASAWTLLQTTSLPLTGSNTNPNYFVLSAANRLNINPNQTYGFYIRSDGNIYYNTITSNSSYPNSNSSITINCGVGIAGTFGGTFSPRAFCGTLYFGGGCAGNRVPVTATINPLLQGVSFAKGSTYQGNYLAGTVQQPDNAKAGSQVHYSITPPTGLTNSDYGTLWTIPSTSVMTATGTSAATATFTAPTASSNGFISITANAAEIDSTFIISVTARNSANNCDTIITRYLYVAPEPVPGFSNNIACAGAIVNFTDTSKIVRGTLSYSWNFGDPNSTLDTSNVMNPSYTYSVGGSYTITLRVTSNLGYSTTMTKTIDVGYFPVPSFSVQNKCEGDSTAFINKTTLQGPALAINYLWNFGDSNLSASTSPKHLYNNIGVYTVTLRATTAFGCSATYSGASTVFPIPVADFAAGTSCEGGQTSLTNNSSIAFGTMGANWSFGNGKNSNEFSTVHTFATAGNYSVRLITYSDFGCSDTVTKQVTVAGTPKATFATAGNCSGDQIVFTNSTTFSGAFDSEWDLGTGSYVQNNASTVSKQFQPGTYAIRLKTTSGLCSSSESMNITVKESPVASFSAPASACIGSPVQITNNTTGIGNLSYAWTFGDATNSTAQSPSKTYTSSGSFQIGFAVVSDNGCSDSATSSIQVNVLPSAAYSFTKSTVFESRQVTFAPGSTSFFDYNWEFGDGTISNQVAPVYTYLSNGPFNARLTVTDNNGCSNTTTQVIAFNVSSKSAVAQNFSFDVYPNPFISSANIQYTLSKSGRLEVKVLDMSGREVAILFNGEQASGSYQLTFLPEQYNLPAGNYLVRLALDGDVASKQIIRIK